MRPPAEKTTPYFNLFAVSARGLILKLETSDTDTELNISLTMV